MSEKHPRKRLRVDSEEDSSDAMEPVAGCSKEPDKEVQIGQESKVSQSADSAFSAPFMKASDLIKITKKKYRRATVEIDSSDSDTDFDTSRTPKKSRRSLSSSAVKSKLQDQNRHSDSSLNEAKKSSGSNRHRRSRTIRSDGDVKCKKISSYFKLDASKQPPKISETVHEVESDTSIDSSKKCIKKDTNEKFFKKIRHCYGLLGDSCEEDFEEDRPNYFEKLPGHILETILCQIPMPDLLRCRFVCKLWDSIISDAKFMDWKRLYYKIKLKDPRSIQFIKKEADKFGLCAVEDAFSVFIKYMSEGYKRKPSVDMYDLLKKNTLAATAELVLEERFPNLCKEQKPWSIFATAILLSETVWDIYNLYKSLFVPNSQCSVHDVTNALYCAASFLIYFRNTLHLNYGLHYRVYYTIYLIENTLPSKDVIGSQTLKVAKGLPGQQSIHSYCESSKSHLTYEQLRILNHCIQPKQIIKIVALAGTGKTTTLVHLAQLYPQVKFLIVMYNKAICEEAKRRFPRNVTCKTAHSLAYATHGVKYRFKLTTKIKPHDIVGHLQHKGNSSLQIFSYAKLVLQSIDAYIISEDEEISLEHVPVFNSTHTTSTPVSSEDRSKLLLDAKHLWSLMTDLENKNVRVTHDVYLKLYQLSKPDLSQYQCLMVDEAQDCNPAMLSILLSQNLPVILVGDPNQQIYGFRGAKNALQNIEATHTYHLTKSFRFGPEIAYVASACLENLKHITTNTLVGNEKPSYINGKPVGQYAIIARSNVMLFNEAVRLCCQERNRSHEPSTILGAFVGNVSNYGFNQLLDICKLAGHHDDPEYTIKDKFINKFRTIEELGNYAKNADDTDLQTKIDLVRLHNRDIPKYVKTIKEKCSHPIELANIVFSTAHKAKGLEFDTVCLTDDYQINVNNTRRRGLITSAVEEEEYNVIYVAMTRAKTSLFLPEKLHRVFQSANEKFEYPILSKNVTENGEEVKCVNCSETFIPHTVLALYRREMILSNGRKIQAGALCMKCRTDPKVRTRVEMEPVIMYLDPTDDYAHRSMACLVGPLPNDPPIDHSNFAPFQDMDVQPDIAYGNWNVQVVNAQHLNGQVIVLRIHNMNR